MGLKDHRKNGGGGEKLYSRKDVERLVDRLNDRHPEIHHFAWPETFDEWCYRHKINGNWREALYHGCMAEGAADITDPDVLETLWEAKWAEILAEQIRRMMT